MNFKYVLKLTVVLFSCFGIFSSNLQADPRATASTHDSVLMSQHQKSIDFWSNLQSPDIGNFALSGDIFGLRDINLRAAQVWAAIEHCKLQSKIESLALAVANFTSICPEIRPVIFELNLNYIQFLQSANLVFEKKNPSQNRGTNHFPLHPLLQQFSLNYYISNMAVKQFAESTEHNHNLFGLLMLDVESLWKQSIADAKLDAEAEAAYKRDIRNTSLFRNPFKKDGVAVWAERQLQQIEKMEQQRKRLTEYFSQWDTNYPYLQSYEQFIENNFAVLTAHFAGLGSYRNCPSLGIFDLANLKSMAFLRLRLPGSETAFTGTIESFCNEKLTNIRIQENSAFVPGSHKITLDVISIHNFQRQLLKVAAQTGEK